MKVGIIRCMQTEDACPGEGCFQAMDERFGAFEGIDESIEIIGFVSCGGCPGKKAAFRAKNMVKRGANTIVFSSCITNGTPIGYPCPFAKKMRTVVEKNVGGAVRILDHTH